MIGPPVEHTLDGTRPAVDVQAGQAVHEVDADVIAAGLARRLERRAGAARVVEPAELASSSDWTPRLTRFTPAAR